MNKVQIELGEYIGSLESKVIVDYPLDIPNGISRIWIKFQLCEILIRHGISHEDLKVEFEDVFLKIKFSDKTSLEIENYAINSE